MNTIDLSLKTVGRYMRTFACCWMMSACASEDATGGQSGSEKGGLCRIWGRERVETTRLPTGFDFFYTDALALYAKSWSTQLSLESGGTAPLAFEQSARENYISSVIRVEPIPNGNGNEIFLSTNVCKDYYELAVDGTLKIGDAAAVLQLPFQTMLNVYVDKTVREYFSVAYDKKAGSMEPLMDRSRYPNPTLNIAVTCSLTSAEPATTQVLGKLQGKISWNGEHKAENEMPTTSTSAKIESVGGFMLE